MIENLNHNIDSLEAFVGRLVDWQARTFPPGQGHLGVVKHIEKELKEIEAMPLDVFEWVDLMFLAINGAYRTGHSPDAIAMALRKKLEINENRQWPDWRDIKPGEPIEHLREVPHTPV